MHIKSIAIGLAAVIMLCACLGLFFLWGTSRGDNRIQQAEAAYQKGTAATTIHERQEAFNEALDLFLQLEADYRPHFGTGRLYYNIGNTYFQLGEYPRAILYYMRAQQLMPSDDSVKSHLSLTRKKLDLPANLNASVWDLLLFQPFISLPLRLQLFFCAGCLTVLLFSVWIWTHARWSLYLSVIALSIFTFLLISLIILRYFAPVQAVLVHAVELRRDAGAQFAKISPQPVPAGTVIEVLDISNNGQWYKIAVPGADFGYAPQESVRLVR